MNFWKRLTLILGAVGVAIGAFGAHALEPILTANSRTETWQTAMHYYWIHVLALMIVNFIPNANPQIPARVSIIWSGSILLFCGSLMALSLGAPNLIGAITPLGGVGFIAGWLYLLKLRANQSS